MNQKVNAKDEMHQTLHIQQQAFLKNMHPSALTRRENLKKLKTMLLAHQAEIIEAISDDFQHRSRHETQLFELFPSIEGINFAYKSVKKWVRPERRAVSKWFLPASAKLVKQPLGVIGIIVPWNYPLYLAISPITSALAAGNRVMVKMSEFTPKFSQLFAELIEKTFTSDLITVINGDADVAAGFSSLPFDHLFFTGSTQVGRKVMSAASANLTPVTLELGGKSPTIVAADADIKRAAESIIWGKLANAGQTCIAPDYLYVHESRVEDFIREAKVVAEKMIENTETDFSCIINQAQQGRLDSLILDARKKGAVVESMLAAASEPNQTRKMLPSILTKVNRDMAIMQEEIFGPLLPILSFDKLESVISEINQGERPLALYLFTNSKDTMNKVTLETISGGVCINETLAHVAQDNLPFGGVGASGMGHAHGKVGFDTFTKAKPIFKQARFNASSLVRPPYNSVTDKLIKLMLR